VREIRSPGSVRGRPERPVPTGTASRCNLVTGVRRAHKAYIARREDFLQVLGEAMEHAMRFRVADGICLWLATGCGGAEPSRSGNSEPPSTAWALPRQAAPATPSASTADTISSEHAALAPEPPPPRAVPRCALLSQDDDKSKSRRLYMFHASGRLSSELAHTWSLSTAADDFFDRASYEREDSGKLTRSIAWSNTVWGRGIRVVKPVYGEHGELVALTDSVTKEEMSLHWAGSFGAKRATPWNGVNDAFVIPTVAPMPPGSGKLGTWVPDIRDLGGSTFSGTMTAESVGAKNVVDTVVNFEAGRPTGIKGPTSRDVSFAYEGDRLVRMGTALVGVSLTYDGDRLTGYAGDPLGGSGKLSWSGDRAAAFVSRGSTTRYQWDACDAEPLALVETPRVKRSALKTSAEFSCRLPGDQQRCKRYKELDAQSAENLCVISAGGEFVPGKCDTRGVKAICDGENITTFYYDNIDPTAAIGGCLGRWKLVDD